MKRTFYLIFVILFFLIPIINSDNITRLPMNVSLSAEYYYYIQTSEKLSEGIYFTNETGANDNIQYKLLSGSTNNNAIWNYNKTSQRTEYWVYAYISDITIDICQGAVTHLCSNPGCSPPDNYMININNAKWSKSTINDLTHPSISDATSFVLGYDNIHKVATNLGHSTTIYFRYWLDVPPNTPAYNYNTTYQIMAVLAGELCA